MDSATIRVTSPLTVFDSLMKEGEDYKVTDAVFMNLTLVGVLLNGLDRCFDGAGSPVELLHKWLDGNILIKQLFATSSSYRSSIYLDNYLVTDKVLEMWSEGSDEADIANTLKLPYEFVRILLWVLCPFVSSKIAARLNAYKNNDQALLSLIRFKLAGSSDIRVCSLVSLGLDRASALLIKDNFCTDVHWSVEEFEEWYSDVSMRQMVKYVVQPLLQRNESIDDVLRHSGLVKQKKKPDVDCTHDAVLEEVMQQVVGFRETLCELSDKLDVWCRDLTSRTKGNKQGVI